MTSFKPVALAVSRIVVAGLFVWAALGKAADVHAFAEEIANYQLLPAQLVPLAAIALPGIELVAGLLLLAGVAARQASAVLSLLLVAFIAGLSQALVRGIDLRCGCFGGADVATWGTVVRDVVMLVPALAVARFGGGRWALGRPSPVGSGSAARTA